MFLSKKFVHLSQYIINILSKVNQKKPSITLDAPDRALAASGVVD